MYRDIAIQLQHVIGKIKYLPAVSIILPLPPVMARKEDLKHSIMLIMQKIEQDLLIHYPAEKAVPVLVKLKNVIRNLNYRTHRKSIAICISPVVEKVYYLNIEVKEQVFIDDSFEMRSIIFSKKDTPKYLVMWLSDECSKMYIGNSSGFNLIKSNISGNTLSNNFYRELDHGLTIILKAYPLPLLLIGAKNALESFKKISANTNDIIQDIEVGCQITEPSELLNIILPYEADWISLNQHYLLSQIEKAGKEDKLSFGFDDVWNKAIQNKGKLLILEKKYLIPKAGIRTESFNKKDYLTGNPFYIQDEVDEIIEKVFENGGDVEFVEENVLKDYKQIALIEK